MVAVAVTTKGDRIAVESPYHPDWPSRARDLGGRWNHSARVWTFDQRDEARVREAVTEIYGSAPFEIRRQVQQLYVEARDWLEFLRSGQVPASAAAGGRAVGPAGVSPDTIHPNTKSSTWINSAEKSRCQVPDTTTTPRRNQ